MKKYLLILAAFLTLNILSAKAQTESQLKDSLTDLTCGETVIITATPDSGYTFLYWADDETNTNPEREVTITDSLDLYSYVAVFTKNTTYTLTISVNNAEMGSVDGGTGSYEKGAKVKLTAIPASKCYKFVKWSDNVTTAEREITVSEDASKNAYQAIFEQVEFTVKVTTAVGGKVTIARK